MAEVIYTTANMARNTQGEREERIVDIYATSESLGDQPQDYVGTEESSNTLGTVRSQQPDPVSRTPPRCPIRAVVVLLVLLSLTLLAGLLRFVMQHKTVCMDGDLEQHNQRLENMTEQHKTVCMDRDVEQLELHQRLKNVTEQHKTVSMEVEQLLQRLKNVTEQRDSRLCNQECPIDWNKFGCKCYFSVWGSWNKSRELCVSLGADLLVVDSKEEMDFISGYDGDPWLGATDEASEGSWRWVDGTVLSADNPPWRRGKPSGGKKKNCLRKVWEHPNFKWTDESCEDYRYGLCEFNEMMDESISLSDRCVSLTIFFISMPTNIRCFVSYLLSSAIR
ncbi:C-type lectin domain family 4 member D-like [Gadus morhua]|uniref:C-type lectin domain family 4 member D-like n=1 Tax=Gadus morhua TaxID=8049 RepID=UPI0011B7F28D|nr:C-type lectin domain family 4 member D-like [Gadus morhua]